MVQLLKLTLHIRVLVPVSGALLLLQLPANAPGKSVEDGPVTQPGGPCGGPGSSDTALTAAAIEGMD